MSRKYRKLLEEAIKDLEVECYNKAASAAYFASRMLVEEILDALGERIPRRDDKLINAIRNKGYKKEAFYLETLYELRKRADYAASIDRNQAHKSVKLSKEVIESLEKYLKKIKRQ